ncbi:MAG: hypothetical protein Unbinned3338contig1000_57 [Prokaryotic dsDNA virus sp.]|nr:MAG: hypothetical protein Unbinned3338contig1000_57 [Prokaryotic dsDNA virus sp.]|tara:strand:+ start:2501 stop:3856 length:1356 start_codon:yes stop_codon:yes gene_type:complete
MKIYTEVLMQWDEKKQKLIEVSSSSFDYKGKVDLCGGHTSSGADEWNVADDEYSAGYMAAGMPGGRYPKYLDESIRGTEDSAIFSGEYNIGGEFIGDLGTVDRDELNAWKHSESRLNSGETWLGGGGQVEKMQSMARDFGKQGGYYDKYVDLALKKPFEALAVRGLTEATELSTGLEEEQLENIGLTGGGEKYGLDSDQRYIASDQAVELRRQKEELDIAEQSKIEEQETIEGAKEMALDAKEEQLRKTNIQREQMSGEVLPAEEALRAEQAASGFAYSAPGEQAARTTRSGGQAAFENLEEAERGARLAYDTEIEGLEAEEESIEKDFKAAELRYGGNVANILKESNQRVGDLLGMARQIADAHREQGSRLVQSSVNRGAEFGGLGDWGDYESRANVMRTDTLVGAPTGGFYQEQFAPGFQQIEQFLETAQANVREGAERIEANIMEGRE